MRRLVPLLGVVLALSLSGTAAADTFVVVRPHANSGGVGAASGAPIAFTVGQTGPMSFADLRGIWQAAGSAYGIPWEVLGAINKVETNFGSNLGPSSAGAVGWMQFMPSTWARWGIDANGDGVADPNNPTDAIFSAARYLVACGGQVDIAAAVYCYNHATWYVNEVLGLAALFGNGGGSTLSSVSLGQLQTRLATARTQVKASNEQLVAALAKARKLSRAEQRFIRRAATARLLSDELEARKHAVLLGVRRQAAETRVARLRRLLRAATADLSQARSEIRSSSVATSATALLSLPASSGLQLGRIDQGVDLTSSNPYPALASGKVVHIDPNFWRGTPAVYEKLDYPITVGGRTYDEIYYSETAALVHAGQRLSAGQPVIAAGSAEIGFGSGYLPAAHGLYHEGVPTQAGSDFYTYITAGSPAGLSTPSDPIFFQAGAQLDSYQPTSGGASTFAIAGGATGFTSDVVYFTR